MRFLGLTWVTLISFACIVCASHARAGEERSLAFEYERLDRLQRQVETLPAFREAERLRFEIRQLRRELDFVNSQRSSAPYGVPNRLEVDRLRSKIVDLENQLATNSKMIVDFREAAGGGASGRLFPGVSNRLAVFTFDDPHGTRLGDAVSFLLSKKLLFSAPVSSFAIVNYHEGVERSPAATASTGQTTYFDKVDAVTRDQGFLLAVWGRISRTEKGIRVESFLQVPADANQTKYMRQIRLPDAMGGGSLTARLKSDRVPIQRIDINVGEADGLKVAASQVAILRARANTESRVVGRLEGRYSIIGSDGDWVELQLSDGRRGWTSVESFCSGTCRKLLNIAEFTNAIVAIISGSTRSSLPSGLTRDAAAMSQELAAVASLPNNPNRAIEIAQTWIRSQKTAAPGFENVLAVAKMQNELVRASASGTAFSEVRLSKATVEQLIEPLVEASISDPSDRTIVKNLVPLFDYVGDTRRRDLAAEISSNLN
ncbi:A-type inclusion protein [Bradyrhizobium arachidis]|nr:A-type inclusion protein [Bradyrhizobium arachidis]